MSSSPLRSLTQLKLLTGDQEKILATRVQVHFAFLLLLSLWFQSS